MSDPSSSRRGRADATDAEGDDAAASAARALGARIRMLRQGQQLTLTQLAAQADLSHSFLSQVERGLERMSMTSLFRVAQALGTTQQALLTDGPSAPRPEGAFFVSRANQATPLDAGGRPVRVLAQDHPRFVPMVMSGTFTEDMWWVHDEEEFLYVLEGRLVVVLDDEEFALDAGDAVYYQGGVRHRWRTEPGAVARVLTVKESTPGSH